MPHEVACEVSCAHNYERSEEAYKSWQVVDGDDGAPLSDALGVDLDGRLGERGVDVVDGNGVVRVRCAAMSVVCSATWCGIQLTRTKRRQQRQDVDSRRPEP